jgi:peroxiredoxin
MRKTFSLMVLMLGVAAFAVACGNSEKKAAAQVQGTSQQVPQVTSKVSDDRYPLAPDFELKDLEGKTVRLSDYRGKMVILNFWATWCPPCRMEIPSFIRLYDEFKDKGLVIIGVSLDREGKEVVQKFAANYKINYPVVMGDMNVVAAYGGISAIPTTFIINKNGRVVNRFVGLREESVFRSEIRKWLLGS